MEERILELEGYFIEIRYVDKNREKRMKRNEENFREIWNIILY